MLFILAFAWFRPSAAPAIPFEGSYDRKFIGKVLITLVPPLALIFVVLGSIIMGIATVNQAGAIGAVGATIMAGYRLREGHPRAYWPAILAIASLGTIFLVTSNFSTNIKSIKSSHDALGVGLAAIAVVFFIAAIIWSGWRTFKIEDTLRGVMVETAKTTSLVFIILLGAAMLTAAFRAFGGEELVREFLTSLPGGFWAQFIIVMAVIFLLGFFLDFIEIAVVVVPIVAPILLADPSANVTAVWLGVMIGLNIQTSFLTPPFGFALFYLRGVAPAAVKTIQMYKGVIAFIALQLVALVIVGLYPSLVNYLPNRNSLTSPTAPPPLNPRLQYCIERDAIDEFANRGDELRKQIAQARGLDISYLPKRDQSKLTASFDKADATFNMLKKIQSTAAAVDAAKGAYSPLHRQVRRIQKQIRKLDEAIRETQSQISRLRRQGEASQPQRDKLNSHIDGIEAFNVSCSALIPQKWEEESKQFKALQNAEVKARRDYRRNVDGAYEPVKDLIEVIADAVQMTALEQELNALEVVINSGAPKDVASRIRALSKKFGKIEGASAIRRELSKARTELRRRTPNKE